MKQYSNFNEIDMDLKRLNLERQIAPEEMKGIKGEFQESLRPAQWIQSGLKFASKFGLMLLVKKLIR
ncbi:hypothetical protein N7U66_06740 [Lacinutrix neustonica]|uniref:Glutaminyl-tRNA synthetase n=1 Tax=Lacinutrix neustonica TaxID=2980107 RepID=A0A9E8MX26_9FLAO|nr:hypothetical protein [Lacinutrix neustonica]WAC03262.1 hypothetical protein N7U66_06740 [Lacinutrix neustonica]